MTRDEQRVKFLEELIFDDLICFTDDECEEHNIFDGLFAKDDAEETQ